MITIMNGDAESEELNMKEYEVEVVSSETLYIFAESEEEAEEKAAEETNFSSVDYCKVVGER